MHARYPSEWNINMFAYYSCMAGDEKKTKALISVIGDNPLLSQWGADANRTFKNCKAWRKGWFARNHVDQKWPSWLVKTAFFGGAGLIFILLRVYSATAQRRYQKKLAKLDRDGLLQKSDYEARRVLLVLGVDGHDAHFFVELPDGGVLHLDGEALFELPGSGQNDRSPAFPSTRFRISRNKESGHIVSVENLGEGIDPEWIEQVADDALERLGSLEDGAVISDRTLEQIRSNLDFASAGPQGFAEQKPWVAQVTWNGWRFEEPRAPSDRSIGLGVRIVLAIFATLFGVVMILIAPGAENAVASYGFGGFCLSIAMACVLRGRMAKFFGSLVGTAVLVFTLFALGDVLFGDPSAFGNGDRPSVWSAVIWLVVFGSPAAAYVWHARFGFNSARASCCYSFDRSPGAGGPSQSSNLARHNAAGLRSIALRSCGEFPVPDAWKSDRTPLGTVVGAGPGRDEGIFGNAAAMATRRDSRIAFVAAERACGLARYTR